MRSLIRLIAALLPVGMAVLAGCNDTECLDNRNAIPRAVLYMSQPDAPAVQTTVSGVSIYGVGAPDGAPLYEGEPLSTLMLPFRLDAAETSFEFRYSEDPAGPKDIVTFRYRPEAEFVSAACGACYFFNDLEAEHTSVMIDSIVCPWSRITNIERNYILIYFHPTDEPDAE